jgi:hypothetical protein
MNTHFAPTGKMKKLAKKLTGEVTDEREKVAKIFHYVQSHFKADFASRSIFDQAQTIFNRQVGSSAEVTGIVYALLRSLEIESTPVLVPNRKIVTDLPDVPMLDWFSHLLLRVTADGEELWLDPLYQASGVNHISPEHRGVDGLLVRESDGRLDRIPSLDYSENLRRSITKVSLKADGSIDCESREIYSPLRSAGIKGLLHSQTILEREDELAKRMREYCPGAMLDSYRFSDLYDFSSDFELLYRFHSSHYVQKADSFVYLNPNLSNREETARDFTQPVRIFPIMFNQVKTDVDSVVSGDQLVYKRLLKIKKLLVTQGQYKEVKRFFNRIFEEDRKLITIKRKE